MSNQTFIDYVVKNADTGLYPNYYFGAKKESRETNDIKSAQLFSTEEQAKNHNYNYIKNCKICKVTRKEGQLLIEEI